MDWGLFVYCFSHLQKTSEEGEVSNTERAAALKARGNDAFSTGDYGRALSLYADSMAADGTSESQAKVYANAAAALPQKVILAS